MVIEWADSITRGLQGFGTGFVNFVPNLIAAIVVLIIGWFVSAAIGKLITELLKKIKLDSLLEKTGWKEAMDRVEFKMTASEFIGGLCKWILILVVLMITADILGLPAFSVFITTVITWLGKIVVAALMFMATVIVANFAEKAVKASMSKAKLEYANLAGTIIRWATWIFGIFAILTQLGIATELVTTIFMGLVGMLAIAGGLAFGLGGKEAAANMINDLKTKFRK